MNTNVLTLTDANGNVTPYDFLDLVDYEDAEYAVLAPANQDPIEEIMIAKVSSAEDDDTKEIYSPVTDAAVLNAVFQLFQEQLPEDAEPLQNNCNSYDKCTL